MLENDQRYLVEISSIKKRSEVFNSVNALLQWLICCFHSDVLVKYYEWEEDRQLPANAIDGSGEFIIIIEGIPENGSKGAIARMVTSLWPSKLKVG